MYTFVRKHRCTLSFLFFLLILSLVACANNAGSGSTASSTPTKSPGNTNTGTAMTPSPGVRLGVQACPEAVKDVSHWDPIVITQRGVSAVGRVTCANLIGNSSLQALVQVFYEGTGKIEDVYVFNNITSPGPKQLFKLQGLYKGDAKISNYNTVLTAEVDQGSSINKGQANASYHVDLFREFKWSDGTNGFVPVSFPGIYPHLTRFEAEQVQQDVNQGKAPLLDAATVAKNLAISPKLLNWNPGAQTTVVSGGGKQDIDAVVNVKSVSPGAGTIKVTLSRLEGNANGGIWEVTSVTTDGMAITSPQNRDLLSIPPAITVTGKGNAFEGVVGTVKVLDHVYTEVGSAPAKGASGNGNTTFSTNVTYKVSFKGTAGGTQEGLLILYSTSNANGSIAGTVILKELLSSNA